MLHVSPTLNPFQPLNLFTVERRHLMLICMKFASVVPEYIPQRIRLSQTNTNAYILHAVGTSTPVKAHMYLFIVVFNKLFQKNLFKDVEQRGPICLKLIQKVLLWTKINKVLQIAVHLLIWIYRALVGHCCWWDIFLGVSDFRLFSLRNSHNQLDKKSEQFYWQTKPKKRPIQRIRKIIK